MACRFDNVLDLMERAAQSNWEDSLRRGHVLHLPNYGQVVMTGDFHGYTRNFRKLTRFADLERYPHRHVIIHELIHMHNHVVSGEVPSEDTSCDLLVEALVWKLRFPEQVHFLMGNHDLAQITGREISKAGTASIGEFESWVHRTFGTAGPVVLKALRKVLLSFPLAAKCPNGIALSHSLPSSSAMGTFDRTVFDRPWQQGDLVPGGSVYEWVWGRDHTPEQFDVLGEWLGATLFVVGHQAQENGHLGQFRRMIVLASDHSRGCFLPIDLAKTYGFDDLVARVRYFYELPADDDDEPTGIGGS